MKKIFILAQKELSTFIQSPLAYGALVLMLVVFNTFFYLIIEQNREATLRDMFQVMEFMFVFIIPVITMKSIAEEKAQGTMEFLMTSPLKTRDIVLGKFLGLVALFTVMIAITLSYFFLMAFVSDIDQPATLIGYLGVWLEGVFFIAIGLLASSFSHSQWVGAIGAYTILLFLYFSQTISKYVGGHWIFVLNYLSTITHAGNFFVGVVTVSDVIYYISGIGVCLFFTQRLVERKS